MAADGLVTQGSGASAGMVLIYIPISALEGLTWRLHQNGHYFTNNILDLFFLKKLFCLIHILTHCSLVIPLVSVNTSSYNGSLPDSTKPLPEPMWTLRQ